MLDPVAYSLEKIRLLTGFEKGGESSGGGFEVQIVVESEFNSLAETRVDSADGSQGELLDCQERADDMDQLWQMQDLGSL